MIVFAAGNKYEAKNIKYSEFHKSWYVTGKKWIKSKQKFSNNVLIWCVGQIEPVEVVEN